MDTVMNSNHLFGDSILIHYKPRLCQTNRCICEYQFSCQKQNKTKQKQKQKQKQNKKQKQIFSYMFS